MKLVALLTGLALLFLTFSVQAAEATPQIAELQAGLADLGYDPGPVDGLLGRKTRDAIATFQKDQGLIDDGDYSHDLPLFIDMEKKKRPRELQRRALLAMSDDKLRELLAGANEDEVGRIWDLIPERIADLPIRVALGNGLPPGGEAVFAIPLRLLHYPPSLEGIEQFQHDIGAEATGELTFRQFEEAHRRWLRNRDIPVYPGYAIGFPIQISDHFASGTWVTEDEEIITPINAVEITCDREHGECLRVTAELHIPSIDGDESLVYLSSDDEYYSLQLRPIRRYRVISWSGGEIVALERRGCNVALLTLNRNSNSVQEVVRNDEDVHPNCRLPPIDGPSIAQLTSGWATAREFWRKREEVTGSYINPRVTEEIQQVLGAAASPPGLPTPATGPSAASQSAAEGLVERRRRLLQAPNKEDN